jgi:hypothetical protein
MRQNDNKSQEELLAEILKALEEIAKKLPDANNPSTSLGIIDNADMLKLLKITNRTAIKWRQLKKLPFFRISGEKGKIFYRISDIEKMIEELYGKK